MYCCASAGRLRCRRKTFIILLPSLFSCIYIYRYQSQEKRVRILLRSTEGESGDIDITIVACTSPKAAKVSKYNHTISYNFCWPVVSLYVLNCVSAHGVSRWCSVNWSHCHYIRDSTASLRLKNRVRVTVLDSQVCIFVPYLLITLHCCYVYLYIYMVIWRCTWLISELSTITGQVQTPMLLEWVHAIFPDVPPRAGYEEQSGKFYYSSVFTGSVTYIEFGHQMVWCIAVMCHSISFFPHLCCLSACRSYLLNQNLLPPSLLSR